MTPTTDAIACIVLAAGKGTRMKSDLPKVMHQLAHEPMIAHVLKATLPLSPQRAVVVVAPGMESVQKTVSALYDGCAFAVQEEQKGTGHAVAAGMERLKDFHGTVLVVYGDTPLFTPATLQRLLEERATHGATISLVGMHLADPMGYGRLEMKHEPYVERIIECKDASEAQKHIQWVWGGVMAFDAAFLRQGLSQLEPSPITGEYYLTALIDMASEHHHRSVMVPIEEQEAMGVNSRAQLAQAEAVLQARLRAAAMDAGATLVAPETVFLAADTVLGRDTVVQPHVVFGPGVSVGAGCEIRSFSHLEKARVGANCTVGPYARLRPGTVLEDGVHIGNFVELKATHAQAGAKINHLSYVGDASIGAGANVGAGTITCNYDGYGKHRTEIGARAFIGSNASLVAPVSVGEGAIIGAGSVITQDVPADALGLTRPAQVNREGTAARIHERNRERKNSQ